jgi:hypothetical protein
MFYFRLNRLKILNNKVTDWWILNKDVADVKILSLITTESDDLPNLDGLEQTNDPDQKKEIIKNAVIKVASSRELTTISDVKDDHIMTFGDTGYVLYRAEIIPQDFNWNLVVFKDDRDTRQFGKDLDSIVKDPDFDDFTDKLLNLITGTSNPAYTAAIGIGKFITKTIAKSCMDHKDDMLGVLYMSLNRKEHYPHSLRDKKDIKDLTNNLLIDYSIFGFEGV